MIIWLAYLGRSMHHRYKLDLALKAQFYNPYPIVKMDYFKERILHPCMYLILTHLANVAFMYISLSINDSFSEILVTEEL